MNKNEKIDENPANEETKGNDNSIKT